MLRPSQRGCALADKVRIIDLYLRRVKEGELKRNHSTVCLGKERKEVSPSNDKDE